MDKVYFIRMESDDQITNNRYFANNSDYYDQLNVGDYGFVCKKGEGIIKFVKITSIDRTANFIVDFDVTILFNSAISLKRFTASKLFILDVELLNKIQKSTGNSFHPLSLTNDVKTTIFNNNSVNIAELESFINNDSNYRKLIIKEEGTPLDNNSKDVQLFYLNNKLHLKTENFISQVDVIDKFDSDNFERDKAKQNSLYKKIEQGQRNFSYEDYPLVHMYDLFISKRENRAKNETDLFMKSDYEDYMRNNGVSGMSILSNRNSLGELQYKYDCTLDVCYLDDRCNEILGKIQSNRRMGNDTKDRYSNALTMYVGYLDSINFGQNSMNTNENNGETIGHDNRNISLNTILYGPPGTGKTYNVKRYAVDICESGESIVDYDEKYNHLITDGRIVFTTFHQSYSYEDFIEGIKAHTIDGNVTYDVEDGVFKAFCKSGIKKTINSVGELISEDAEVWKITLKDGAMNNVKSECFSEGYIRIGFDLSEEGAIKFINEVKKGDIILSFKTKKSIDAIGIVTDNQYYELTEKTEYKIAKKVQWLLNDVDIDILSYNDNKLMARMTTARVPNISVYDVIDILKKNGIENIADIRLEKDGRPKVFIIDEINRGNISKIFGELITLIEDTKREGMKEAMSVTLPYSKEKFSVPGNVYILGTMNTADRSIALIDTALRRRFNFIEMMPDVSKLSGIVIEEINIEEMLDKINKRIEVLYDREHTIGHSFFMKLTSNSSISELKSIFQNNIIPLLQEYFYEDYKKIRMVLGDTDFIKEIPNDISDLFKGSDDFDSIAEDRYEINNDDNYWNNPASYKAIYEKEAA